MPGSFEFGAAFEHFIFMELRCYASYSGHYYPHRIMANGLGIRSGLRPCRRRRRSGSQIDGASLTGSYAGLRALREETRLKRSILVCRVPRARKTEDAIEILPWLEFLPQRWAGEIIPIR